MESCGVGWLITQPRMLWHPPEVKETPPSHMTTSIAM